MALRVEHDDLVHLAIGRALADLGGQPTGQRRQGIITEWNAQAAHGSAADGEHRSWFVPRSSLPPDVDSLPVGCRVTFAGSPHVVPGKEYPQAYAVAIDMTRGDALTRSVGARLSP